MKDYEFQLARDFPPAIEIKGLLCAIVTGATVPMLFGPMERFKSYHPKPKSDKTFSVMDYLTGEGEIKGKVVTLSNFRLGGIRFEQCDFFVPNHGEAPYSILLPYSFFKETSFAIKNNEHKFIVKIPKNFPQKRNFILDGKDGGLSARIEDCGRDNQHS